MIAVKVLITISASLRCGKKSVNCTINSKDYNTLKSLIALGVVSHITKTQSCNGSRATIFFTKAAINSKRTLRFSQTTAPCSRQKLTKIDFI